VTNPPRVRLAKGQEVSLGCGTLILITIIILMFSRGGIGELENEVRRHRSEIGDLKRLVWVMSLVGRGHDGSTS
jgi:hypothetical protein